MPGVGHCELELETLYLGSKHVRLVFEPVGARLRSCDPLALQTATISGTARQMLRVRARARARGRVLAGGLHLQLSKLASFALQPELCFGLDALGSRKPLLAAFSDGLPQRIRLPQQP